MRVQKIFISVLFCLPGNFIFAQNNGLGSWNIVNLKYKLTEKWSFFGEAQVRSLGFYTQFHYHEYKAGINYKAHSNVVLTLAAGDYDTYKEGGNFKTPKNNDEFRIWPQITLTQSIKRLKIEQRYRAEFRFTTNGYRNRYRYRIGVSYPFGKNNKDYKPFLLNASNEIFFTGKEPYFERNRYQVSLAYKINKQVAVQLGYLHQFDYKINDETGRDFLQLGIYFELSSQNKNKNKPRQ
jgi:long-subunit fatty acid transport protein